MKLVKHGLVALSIGVASAFSFSSIAADSSDKAVPDLVTLADSKLGLKVSAVSESPLPGIYELITNSGIIYSDAQLDYVFQGTLIDINRRADLTEQSMGKLRKAAISEYADDMIVYPAKEQQHVVTIFTDADCGYCRKLHGEMNEYTDSKTDKKMPGYSDLGITVRYLAFPRAGVGSHSYDKMVNVWCSEDQLKAMDLVKRGGNPKADSCENSVQQQYELGQALGVRGTPAMILEDGTMLPGYQNPTALAAYLNSH